MSGHGLVTGATGTGKTVSLQAGAEKRASEAKENESARCRSSPQTPTEAAIKSYMRIISSTQGREIMRGFPGVVKKGGR